VVGKVVALQPHLAQLRLPQRTTLVVEVLAGPRETSTTVGVQMVLRE
jgi:hypothetical protein